MTTNELLIATGNKGKVAELRLLLAGLSLRLRDLAEFSGAVEVEETGQTFADNAALKAQGYAGQTGLWTLADDSGLEVEALGGAPGVYSARYGGAGLTDAGRVELLLEKLSGTAAGERRARFVCVIAIADPGGRIRNLSTGTCEGRIVHAPRGTRGFGYDPVFLPDGFEQTFGELPAEIKHDISHRARALKAARSFLVNHFQSIR
ncbi:MAG TPA: RdgB/HAM1 family non-canonical purine NTP pyrophosphatase [Pyrinomonadaceae bacterium]|nr:RdgB/HAM1 family non-canonical purine NTP pyrophosphatase [Pyrinomonadaceae bacterium]